MLVVVHTEELCFFRGTQLEAGDEIDDFSEDRRHDKGIGGPGDNGSNLPSNEHVVAVDKATNGSAVHSIESNDATAREKGVENEANHATDTVFGEDVEGVVDADEELDCKSLLEFLRFTRTLDN